jgi:aspartate/methionine/tyrosine aminotransferase
VYRLTERDPARRLPQMADVYERGISFGGVSKAYGLPGLRIGWVACRNRKLLQRIATVRQYLSTCSAGPSEVLASIALKATDQIVGRNRAIAETNLSRLLPFLLVHEDLFSIFPPEGGVVCYPRYKGQDGVERFVARMAEVAGVLLLPASVFRSELLELPADRFRIGFGRLNFGAGLEAMERALS